MNAATTGAGDHADANLTVLQSAFEALNRRDIDACTALMTDGFLINIAEMPYQKRGIKAWRDNVATMLAAFPDTRVEVNDAVASGDLVAVRVTLTGTHKGEFLGTRPTGKTVRYESHEFYRFENGKLAEEWICSDTLTLMTQIGALSERRMLSMWLAGYRLWLGIAIGAIAGGLAAALIF